ncbi:MAG: phosphodiester glycosidase family protein [Alistipes sp.]
MKLKLIYGVLLLAFASMGLCMCSDSKKEIVYDFPNGEDPTPDPEVKYPAGLTVTEFTEDFGAGKQCRGFVAIADLKANPKLRFNAVHLPAQKTPTRIHADFASAGKGTPYITTNAGYWWAGNSLSLLITDGVVKSIENQSVTRDNKTVYPVRSSFGMMTSGNFETHWIYCVLDDGNKPYAFPSALDNDERTKTYMTAPPTSKTAGASLWTPREAVGGGPMLVKKGMNVAVDNYWKEVFDGGGIAGTSRQPRTAVGATADGKIVLLVCDGRSMRGSAGYTLKELADKLISLGVVDAINLDGGGSSTMVGCEGTVLNRPSDTGDAATIVERKISTAIVISEQQ